MLFTNMPKSLPFQAHSENRIFHCLQVKRGHVGMQLASVMECKKCYLHVEALRVSAWFAPSPSHCCYHHSRVHVDELSANEWPEWLISLLTYTFHVAWINLHKCKTFEILCVCMCELLLRHNLAHPICNR